MADRTTASITVAAPRADVMAVIADFASYPGWAPAVRAAAGIRRGGGRPARPGRVGPAGRGVRGRRGRSSDTGGAGGGRGVSKKSPPGRGAGGGPADVWARATVPPADEAPECAWCPVCRAARVLRESGPGVSSQMAAAGEAVGVLARDAMSVFESALAATRRAARTGAGEGQPPAAPDLADLTLADPEEP